MVVLGDVAVDGGLEVDVVSRLIQRLPTSAPPPVWAAAVLGAARQPGIDREQALGAVLASDCNVERSAVKIAEIYATELAQVCGAVPDQADRGMAC